MADAVKDILFENDDLVIIGGDLKVNKSDQMHIEHIIRADKGHFRQHPLVGVGALRNQNASLNPAQLKQDIRIQLIGDNYAVKEIIITEDFKVSVNATRKL